MVINNRNIMGKVELGSSSLEEQEKIKTPEEVISDLLSVEPAPLKSLRESVNLEMSQEEIRKIRTRYEAYIAELGQTVEYIICGTLGSLLILRASGDLKGFTEGMKNFLVYLEHTSEQESAGVLWQYIRSIENEN